MPEKLTTAPISVRPCVSAAISRATSKSASWMRMVTRAVMGSSRFIVGLSMIFSENRFPLFRSCSAAGHRREKGDLAGAGDYRIRFDVGVVDRGADHPR